MSRILSEMKGTSVSVTYETVRNNAKTCVTDECILVDSDECGVLVELVDYEHAKTFIPFSRVLDISF